MNRAAIYVRASADKPTTQNQLDALHSVAALRGWVVVAIYEDKAINAKGREKRPGLDGMLEDATARKFDVVLAFAMDRVGRSLSELFDTSQHLEACQVDLY